MININIFTNCRDLNQTKKSIKTNKKSMKMDD